MIKIENLATSDTEMMVCADITAPLYWWKNFDFAYLPGMSTTFLSEQELQDKEFTLDDFSHDHLINYDSYWCNEVTGPVLEDAPNIRCGGIQLLNLTINTLNYYRDKYLKTNDKKYWWQMAQTIPSSYNYTRTVTITYDALVNVYKSRRMHYLDEWRDFCDWIETLPHSEFILIAAGLDENSINARLGLARNKEKGGEKND